MATNNLETSSGIDQRPTTETLKRKVRVLHLIYSPGYGGIETAVINWVLNFDRSEFEVHVANFVGDRNREIPFLQAAEKAGIHVWPVPWTKFKPFLRCAREVARLVRELGIDIVHTHAYYGDAVGAITGFLVPVKTVATIYVWAAVGKYELHRQLMQVIDWTAIQFMDQATGHCLDTARRTYVLGTPTEKIPVLLPGMPVHKHPPAEKRRQMRQAAGVRDDEILLVNAARLAPEKAQDQLIRSFRGIHDKFPNTRLWICGVGMDSIEKMLLDLRKQLNLEHAVDMVGFIPNHGHLDVADMMVHPSHVEGMPLAVLGGMAAGLPIVASAVSGVPELIEHGRSGFLVKENDEEGFTRCVNEMLADWPRAQAMGRAALQRVETGDLSMRAAIDSVQSLYCEMMQHKKPRGRLSMLRPRH
jgi:glycosyltransferase involved in cell wall biosynthesis